jgi:hypothetical protein
VIHLDLSSPFRRLALIRIFRSVRHKRATGVLQTCKTATYQGARGHSLVPEDCLTVRVALQELSTAMRAGFVAGDAFTVLTSMDQSKYSKLPL